MIIRFLTAAAFFLFAGGAWGQQCSLNGAVVDITKCPGAVFYQGPVTSNLGFIIAPSTPGNILASGSGGLIIDSSRIAAGFANVPVGLNQQFNINYAGASAPVNSWYFLNGSIFGTATPGTNGSISPFSLTMNDAVNTGATGYLIGFHATDAPTTGHTGGRAAIQGDLAVVGTPAATPGAGGYIAGSFVSRISANLTGTTGAYGNYAGGTFALGGNLFLTSGATFVSLATAQENDITIPTGASAAEKHGLTLVLGADDAVRGAYDDNAMQISSQDGASTWKTGIMFGGYAHQWSFGADSTLIGAQVRQAGPSSPSVALNGADFSSVAFQSGGCAFKSTGFCVDPSGNTTHASAIYAANQTPPAVASGQVWVGMIRGSSGAGFCTYEMVTSTNTQIIQANVPGGGC